MFFKETFSKVLSDINSTYSTMTDFANVAKLDRSYISKYINQKLKNPPTPKQLEKIANASNNIITYEQLMRICGYFGNIRGDRLKSCRLRKNLSISEVANAVGTSSRKISFWENGHDYNIDFETSCKLADFYNVSFEWLSGFNVDEQNLSNKLKEISLPDENITKIPVLGIVKAGYNYLADENIIGYVTVNDSLNTNEFFALEVKGNSMEPLIYEKDIAIVKKQNDFENGDIVVALINGDEATIKRAYKTDDGLILQAINSSIQPLVFNKNDIETMPVRISGIVYNITRKFK